MSVSEAFERPLTAASYGEEAVELQPIAGTDLPEVARFLHDELDPRVSTRRWAVEIRPTWAVDQPNHGFLLRHRGDVVGAHLAFYSERLAGGATQRFCNLAAWCVAEPYRSHAIRLLRALLRQPNYHFTDLSPSAGVQTLNERLGFVALDTTTVVVPNLPRPARSRRIRVVSRHEEIVETLSGEDLMRYLDHADAAAAHHAVIVQDAAVCHVVYRRVRRKSLPLFAALLYVGNGELFLDAAPHLFRHLLLRHAIPATLIEAHVARGAFPGALPVSGRAKMYRSDTLRADQIDYLYSELTNMRW